METEPSCCAVGEGKGVGERDERKWEKGIGYVFLLAYLAAAPPLSTDMYLAAIPHIAEQWGEKVSVVSLSLSLWFVVFSAVILVCGPMSDKWGRKPVLVGGLFLFMVGSLLCGLAGNVWEFIGFRLIQATGAAGPASMVMAICRDKFEGEKRKSVLAWVAIILGVAPMCAPTLGALLMGAMGWRAIFMMQFLLGVVGLGLVLVLFRETAEELLDVGCLKMLGRYKVVLSDGRFMATNKVLGLIVGPYFGFIGFSSIVYIKIYGLSEFWFGILFAWNAVMSMCGAFASTRLNGKVSDGKMLWLCLGGCLVGGVMMLMIGGMHPLAFAGAMSVITLSTSTSRPVSNHLILEQVKTDVGSASSLVVFYQFVLAALFIWLVTLSWGQPVVMFGVVAVVVPMFVSVVWSVLGRKIVAGKEEVDDDVLEVLEI